MTGVPTPATERPAAWQEQLRRSRRPLAALAEALGLPAPTDAQSEVAARYPVAVTPGLIDLARSHLDGARVARQFVPHANELDDLLPDDPLGEDAMMPVPGLLQRYPDRVVLLATNACAAYCRFCTRKRRVGHRAPTWFGHRREILAWLAAHTEVRDVLISGGDPLILPDPAVDRLLTDVEGLAHVRTIRVGTRAPVVLPERLTPALVARLARSRRVWLNTQVNHVAELTPACREALARVVDAGIPVGNQAVLLKGVNDDATVLEALFCELVALRVRPYYLFVCEPGRGLGHFRTSVARAVELMAALRGRVSGLALPTLAVDLPGGAGKVALAPEGIVGRDGDALLFRAWGGDIVRYPDTRD
jgi:lysine 2,3-aminomutase